jgi:hypothetical protein
MSDKSNGITFRTIQEAMPEYHISADLVRGVVSAMPPPAAGISYAWRRERLARVIEEIAARVPMDAAQGHLAGQLVVVEFLADEMLERVTTWDLSLAERRLASRTSDDLIRSASRLERTLERRQARVMPFRDVGVVAGFDLDALDAVWCRGMPAAEPVVAPAAPVPPARPAPETPGAAKPEAEDAAASVGQVTGDGNPDGHAGRGRAGVTLEQGDGWSLEVWPAGADASAGAGVGTPDGLTDKGTKSGAAMGDRAVTDRPGSRGAA